MNDYFGFIRIEFGVDARIEMVANLIRFKMGTDFGTVRKSPEKFVLKSYPKLLPGRCHIVFLAHMKIIVEKKIN